MFMVNCIMEIGVKVCVTFMNLTLLHRVAQDWMTTLTLWKAWTR